MAISNALTWQLNNGGSAADLYDNIRTFLAASPDAATTQAAMAQYGISGEDVANATGGKSGGLLEGNILAGASWNSLNTTLGDQLTQATGQATSNYAVGGATTSDTLNQLNTYLAGGGQFDPNATVFLQTGGVDFLQV
jgi:kynureninase